jgi:hypothetical protein
VIRDNSLPTERDFDPWGGDLDAQCAWRNFGGLTIDQARTKFCENPLYYQEDFMFMGGKAFAYYFPIIEQYLRAVPDASDDDDHESWILAKCIQNQFTRDDCAHVRHLAERALDLAEFVCQNIHRFGIDNNQRQSVANAWAELVDAIQTVVRS